MYILCVIHIKSTWFGEMNLPSIFLELIYSDDSWKSLSSVYESSCYSVLPGGKCELYWGVHSQMIVNGLSCTLTMKGEKKRSRSCRGVSLKKKKEKGSMNNEEVF